jgi:hypothetical protein
MAFPAAITLAAADSRGHRHIIARPEITGKSGGKRLNEAYHFMPHYPALIGLFAAKTIHADIGTADRTGFNLDQSPLVPQNRYRRVFQPQLFITPIAICTHKGFFPSKDVIILTKAYLLYLIFIKSQQKFPFCVIKNPTLDKISNISFIIK